MVRQYESCENRGWKIYGVILCGGEGKRIGGGKPDRVTGGMTMVNHVLRSVQPFCDEVLMVRTKRYGAESIELGTDFLTVLFDETEGLGPMEGIRTAMTYVQAKNNKRNSQEGTDKESSDSRNEFEKGSVFVVLACDYPFLCAGWVPFLLSNLEIPNGEFDSAIPLEGGRWHVLNAVYKGSALQHLNQMIKDKDLRLQNLPAKLKTKSISIDEVQTIDPSVRSLVNVNCVSELETGSS